MIKSFETQRSTQKVLKLFEIRRSVNVILNPCPKILQMNYNKQSDLLKPHHAYTERFHAPFPVVSSSNSSPISNSFLQATTLLNIDKASMTLKSLDMRNLRRNTLLLLLVNSGIPQVETSSMVVLLLALLFPPPSKGMFFIDYFFFIDDGGGNFQDRMNFKLVEDDFLGS